MSIGSTKIYPIGHDWVYALFAKEMRKSRVAIIKEDTKTHYLAYMSGVHPIGVVGYMDMGKGHYRLKTDYVRPNFRGQGVYSDLFISRLLLIFRGLKPNKLTAYCTMMSLPKYLKEGFIAMSERNGIVYVQKLITNTHEELQRLESRIPQSITQTNQQSQDLGVDSPTQTMS